MKLSLILFYGMNLLEMKIICFDGVVLQSGILYGNAAFIPGCGSSAIFKCEVVKSNMFFLSGVQYHFWQ
jgi:hypothetical protein